MLGDWLAALPPNARVLDVGCAGQGLRQALPHGTEYIGLDYPVTASAYATRPMVYGDAHGLPLPDASIDVVLLMDVLEHLRDPEQALDELRRVLRPGGQLVLSVPFCYPLHDAPHDYTRWTEPGLRALAGRHGFCATDLRCRGEPLETAALLFNLALVRSVAEAWRARSPGLLLAPLVPPLVLVMNLLGPLLARLSGRQRPWMPFAYLAVWVRSPHF